jgi:zinc/manganese transport system substrate-binding protein
MSKIKTCGVILLLLALSMIAPAYAEESSAKFKIVCTTSVLMDPVTYIGGDKVEAITIADPTLCPHLQSDIIPNRIQLNKDFIASADMFMAYDATNDKTYVTPAVNDFMNANGYGAVTWYTIPEPSSWNTPAYATLLASQVLGGLKEKDPGNGTYYEQHYNNYIKTFNAIEPTATEKKQLNNTSVVVMLWQKDAVQNWLGMNVVNIFAPEFALNGTKTPAKIVDDINAHPEKYRAVTFVIENMQSGELAKGIEEALRDKGINATRVIFTNYPRSVPGTDTMADVLNHNKQLVLRPGVSCSQ